MSVPDHFTVDVDATLGGGLSINTGTVGVDIKNIPKLSLGIDPLDIAVRPLDIAIKPLEVWFGLKEVPRIRVHVPANFSVCLSCSVANSWHSSCAAKVRSSPNHMWPDRARNAGRTRTD